MLTQSDLLHIPYTPDLTEAGITYTCRSLQAGSGLISASPFNHLRRVVSSVVVELSFRRYLVEHKIPFNALAAEPFTDPDHYDVTLGGHRCEIITYLICRRPQIAQLREDPGTIFQAPALIPQDDFAREGHRSDDLYLFAFLLGLTAAGQVDVAQALATGQPTYLVHLLPDPWARPIGWAPIEGITLKSECDVPIVVEIGGQDAERNFITCNVALQPHSGTPVQETFYSLHYIHTKDKPSARVEMQSPRWVDTHVIQPLDWGNIWVYGMNIILAGWLTHEEIRKKGTVLNPGMVTFQFARTRVKNLTVPLIELHPLGLLFDSLHA